MEDFRVRIARVKLKASPNLTVHRFPEPEYLDDGTPEPESPMISSFLDTAFQVVDDMPNLVGYVVMGFTKEGAAIALRHDEDVAHHHFMVSAQHVLEHYERYSDPPEAEDFT